MPTQLGNPTLVLNKNWLAIGSTSTKKAIKAVCSKRALIVDPVEFTTWDMDTWVGRGLTDRPEAKSISLSDNLQIETPEIITTVKYDRIPRLSVVFCRRNLWRRDHFFCQYCGKRPKQDEITIDHVIPRSRGGISSFDNCVLACIACNLRKRNRTPKESGMYLIRTRVVDGNLIRERYDNPSRPLWSPLYSLKRRTYPVSWKHFLRSKDVEMLYWETELET